MERTYVVYSGTNDSGGVAVNERCILNADGDYIGIHSGVRYLGEHHYHKLCICARIEEPDDENLTGMEHLYANGVMGVNKKRWKERYKGCYVTVYKAHVFNDLQIYRCTELDEYFSENELHFLQPNT